MAVNPQRMRQMSSAAQGSSSSSGATGETTAGSTYIKPKVTQDYTPDVIAFKHFLLNFRTSLSLTEPTPSMIDEDELLLGEGADEEMRREEGEGGDGFRSIFDTDADLKYCRQLEKVAKRKAKKVDVWLDDLEGYYDPNMPDLSGKELVQRIESNCLRYLELAYTAVDAAIKELAEREAFQLAPDALDVLDVLAEHRRGRERTRENENETDGDQPTQTSIGPDGPNPQETTDFSLPIALQRRYEVVLRGRKQHAANPLSLRDIRGSFIGKLVVVKGIVTRTSLVQPMIHIATYTCDTCGYETYQEVTSKDFMPLDKCQSEVCRATSKTAQMHLQTRGSKFFKYQELRLQELPDHVPIGRVPRSITVQTVGEVTRQCSPGDLVTIHAIFLPTPFTGWQALRAGLIADTYLYALHIEQEKKNYKDYEISEEMAREVNNLCRQGNVYEKMAKSLAPEIYGHENVKKALLLMMVGGSTRTLNDGMKIRGDINICLMGDPGVAKSQLLKHISKISPRGVYTTGKGASGVGLTAAVIRDPTTKEFVLEGGSLVLADMGICCIDEFDKMEEADRTAIHEVMEQQTISISKAGINTTLNARTAILAAANPAYGRYNPRRSPSENINLPAALLSRFDLMFLILDRANYDLDRALADHVLYVHRHARHPDVAGQTEPLSTDFMRSYVSQARKYEPFIDPDLTPHIMEAYVKMRQLESDTPETAHTYTTARTLLGILRLSQSLARLCFRDVVHKEDVDEAIRLMDASKSSLIENVRSTPTSNAGDPISMVYQLVRDISLETRQIQIPTSLILERASRKGFAESLVFDVIDMYEGMSVWVVDSNRTSVTFCDSG